MPDKEPPPMHADFPRWYAAVALGDDEARRASRWAGIVAVIESADSHVVEALTRLAFKSRQPPATAPLQKIRDAFRSADATFEMQGNDRELQILAGASLAALMHDGGGNGAEAALAATTTSLVGARKPELPFDLSVLAESAIEQIAQAQGTRPNLASHAHTEAPKFDFEKSAAKVRAEWNQEAVAQGFIMAADAMRATFAVVTRRQANAVNALDTFLRVQDEELQMLWWLIGQRSSDLDCSFEEVPVAAQPLVFGKELSDRTQFLPGPASMKGLLSRAGLKERKKITVSDAINAADADWVRKFMPEREPSPVSTPLHYAIRRQLETGPGDTWIAGWAAAVGVPGTLALSPLTLGNLFYRERLVLIFGDE